MILPKNEKNKHTDFECGYIYHLYLVAVRHKKRPKIVSYVGPIQGEYLLTGTVECATKFSCLMEAENNKESLAKAVKNDSLRKDFDMEHPFTVEVTIKTYEDLGEEVPLDLTRLEE